MKKSIRKIKDPEVKDMAIQDAKNKKAAAVARKGGVYTPSETINHHKRAEKSLKVEEKREKRVAQKGKTIKQWQGIMSRAKRTQFGAA